MNEHRGSLSEVLRASQQRPNRQVGVPQVLSHAYHRAGRWLTQARTRTTRQAGRIGLSILGTLFLVSLGLAIVVVLVTITLFDIIEYVTDRKLFDQKE